MGMRQKRKESTVRVLGCISQREIDIEMERDRDHKVRNPEHDSVRKYQPGKRGRRACRVPGRRLQTPGSIPKRTRGRGPYCEHLALA